MRPKTVCSQNLQRDSGLRGYRIHIDITDDMVSLVPDATQQPQETPVRRSHNVVVGHEPHRGKLES